MKFLKVPSLDMGFHRERPFALFEATPDRVSIARSRYGSNNSRLTHDQIPSEALLQRPLAWKARWETEVYTPSAFEARGESKKADITDHILKDRITVVACKVTVSHVAGYGNDGS